MYDHFPIVHIDSEMKLCDTDSVVTRRNLSYKNRQRFYESIFSLDRGAIYSESDTQAAFSLFHSTLLKHSHINFSKLNDGSFTTDGYVISNKFNDFFVNIGPNLAAKIPEQILSPLDFMEQPLLNSIYLSEVTSGEISNILKSLNNGAAGYDELKACLLKHISPFITEPLKYLSNLSLSEGVFPTELKLANVIPLYKADDVFWFSNYRPVSLLCVISKVFEKVMYNRLIDFLETFAILNNSQFGFRKMHSTYVALMTFMNRLISSIENDEYILGIFLDFSKAFDTVDHVILLKKKLAHYEIRGIALKWFESYLSNREQYVTYNGMSSSK